MAIRGMKELAIYLFCAVGMPVLGFVLWAKLDIWFNRYRRRHDGDQ